MDIDTLATHLVQLTPQAYTDLCVRVEQLQRDRSLAGCFPTHYAAPSAGGSAQGSPTGVNRIFPNDDPQPTHAYRLNNPMNVPMSTAETEARLYHQFASGAKRSERYEERYDLIPHLALQRLGRRYFMGAVTKEYGEWNWQKGLPLDDTFNHAIDHLYRWAEDIRLGRKTDPDHLAGAMWGIVTLMNFEQQYEKEAHERIRARIKEQVQQAAKRADREIQGNADQA